MDVALNETVPIIRELAQFLAHLVHNSVYPAEYRRVHIDNGRRFEVIVREFKRPDDTQPMRRVVDEENGMID